MRVPLHVLSVPLYTSISGPPQQGQGRKLLLLFPWKPDRLTYTSVIGFYSQLLSVDISESVVKSTLPYPHVKYSQFRYPQNSDLEMTQAAEKS